MPLHADTGPMREAGNFVATPFWIAGFFRMTEGYSGEATAVSRPDRSSETHPLDRFLHDR